MASAAGLGFGCGKPKPTLNLFIYPDYIDPGVVADFETKHGCVVRLDIYESPGSMMAKMEAGGAAVYDLFVPGHYTVPSLAARGLLAPIRYERIPNFKHIDAQFNNPSFDPGNRHSVPYLWGTVGIYLRRVPGRETEETWGLLYDPTKQPGRFLLLEDDRLMIGSALWYRGYGVNTVEKAKLGEAKAMLIEAKARSLGFAGSFAARNRVLGKDVEMAVVYSNDALRGQMEDPETTYILPREGSGLWLDTFSIPAQAPNRELAEGFIDHVLEPRNAARIANFTRTATANRAAQEFIDPKDRENEALYPGPEVMRRLEYGVDLGEQNKLFDELWIQIKSV